MKEEEQKYKFKEKSEEFEVFVRKGFVYMFLKMEKMDVLYMLRNISFIFNY